MKIKTATCSSHRARYGLSEEHAAHPYRFLRFGPARRCPKNTWMADYIRWQQEHPTLEEQTVTELRRIRQLLEQHDSAARRTD